MGLAVRHPSTFALLLPDCRPGRGYHGAPPLLFGRRPPQSNCPLRTVPVRATDRGGPTWFQGGISPMAPRGPPPPPRCLPPILHRNNAGPVPTCSKGSRGFSV